MNKTQFLLHRILSKSEIQPLQQSYTPSPHPVLSKALPYVVFERHPRIGVTPYSNLRLKPYKPQTHINPSKPQTHIKPYKPQAQTQTQLNHPINAPCQGDTGSQWSAAPASAATQLASLSLPLLRFGLYEV